VGSLEIRVYVRAVERAANDSSKCPGGSKAPTRCLPACKHPACLAGRAISTQVGGQGFACICREGHAVEKHSLASNEDFANPPIDVFELESDHFPGAKTKTGE